MKQNLLRYKAVCFDLDGTLVEEKSSWITIHEHFGTGEKAKSNLRNYDSGRIDYEEFMRRDIALWPSGLKQSDIDEILSHFCLKEGAQTLVEFLSPRFQCTIISAGIDLLTKRVANRLRIPSFLANGLETDGDGYLTGNGIKRVELGRKDLAFKTLLESKGIESKECIVIGDSPYDERMFEVAGYSIEVNETKVLKSSSVCLKDLRTVLDLIRGSG